MSEQLEEVMEDLAEQRIEKQKTGYEKDRIKLWVKIQEMAAGKESWKHYSFLFEIWVYN